MADEEIRTDEEPEVEAIKLEHAASKSVAQDDEPEVEGHAFTVDAAEKHKPAMTEKHKP